MGEGRAASAVALRVQCLGGFRIAGPSGWERGPDQRRAREIVQYLVLHSRSVAGRERLIDLLWPGDSPELVLHRLHAAVSSARTFLRRFVGCDAIRYRDEGYSWRACVEVDSDVGTFAELYREGSPDALRRAVALYRGELFDGQDSDWVRPERVKYASMYASMVERLAGAAFAAGDFEQALQFGLELLAADRAHEGASRLVIRAFGALGRRGQAAEEYAALRTYLRKHFGIEPMPQTTAELAAVLRCDSA